MSANDIIAALRAEFTQLKRELNEKNEAIEDLEQTIDDQSKEITDLERTVENQSEEIMDLEEQIRINREYG